MQCQEQHLRFSKHIETDWPPTRLLDMSDNPIRLRSSSREKISGPYATLSHCWGTEHFQLLSTENMSQLLEGVPFTTFPYTSQNIITTARQLLIDYPWIDCYCIIQGLDLQAQAD